MPQIAPRKLHFAPLVEQQRQIDRLLRQGRYRNATHFLRCAIDAYLERLGRPSLGEQARRMAEEFHRGGGRRRDDPSRVQDPSRASSESW